MVIERAGFLLMAGTLAAGAGAGWLARDSKAHRERADEVPTAPAAVPAPSATTVVVVQPPPAPTCDDSVGTPDDCPAVGPADEGVCSNVAAKRCADFKSTFKPKVAQAAVACLRQLKSNEQCDAARVNLCGHSALMAACPEPPPPASNANVASNSAGVADPSSPVSLACENILKSCASQPVGPSLADCRQTLSGMSDFGRASMITCMQTHCGDKGLLGCEGVKSP
jgi:hypothetical protein